MHRIVNIENASELRRGQSPQAVTRRESEILELAHLKQREIAAELKIAPETVRTHQKHIRLKLGAETWTAAAIAWNRRAA